MLSPHFDDACFSTGGLLLKKTSKEVVILNVFSKTLFAPNLKLLNFFSKTTGALNIDLLKELVIDYVSKRRQKEDLQYCKTLSLTQKVLPFNDSPLRGYIKPYVTDENITKELAYEAVFRAIEKSVSCNSYDSILCPLGVGNPVDHLLVFYAFMQVLKRVDISAEIFFYEDLPYASDYDLDSISSLAQERTESANPVLVDITSEIPLKQSLIDVYQSQLVNELKQKILYHAKRLFESKQGQITVNGYCERFWRLAKW